MLRTAGAPNFFNRRSSIVNQIDKSEFVGMIFLPSVGGWGILGKDKQPVFMRKCFLLVMACAFLVEGAGAGCNRPEEQNNPSGEENTVMLDFLTKKLKKKQIDKTCDDLLAALSEGDIARAEKILKADSTITRLILEEDSGAAFANAFDNLNEPDVLKKLFTLLLDAGADVNVQYDEGENLLMQVIQDVDNRDLQLELVKLFLQYHPNLELKDIEMDCTVLTHAAGDVEVLKLLIEAGSDVNSCSSYDGRTALMEAAEHGCPDSIRLLLEHGANPNAKDEEGHTALDYVGTNSNLWGNAEARPECARLLKEAMEK